MTEHPPGTRVAKVWLTVGVAGGLGLMLKVDGVSAPVVAKPNVTGPPLAVFWITSRANFSLVNVQTILAPASTNAAGIVITLPATVPNVPVLPVTALLISTQEIEMIR